MSAGGFGEHGEGTITFDAAEGQRAAADVPFCANTCGRVADVQVTVGVWRAEYADLLRRAVDDDVVADVEWLCAPCAATARRED